MRSDGPCRHSCNFTTLRVWWRRSKTLYGALFHFRHVSIRRERETSRGNRRRLHDRGCGLPVGQQFVQYAIKVRDFLQKHLENEAIFTRHVAH